MSFCCLLAKSCLTLETPWTAARQASVFNCLWEFAQIHVHWVSDTIQPFHFMLPPSLALNLSQHQSLFRSVGSVHQVAKVFSFSISPSNEYSGFISFRIDWFDIAAQGTLKGLLQYHNSKASILQHSAFIMVQTVTYVGEGNGNPLQYSCLENPMDRRAWWAAVHRVAQSRTWLTWLSSSSSTGSQARTLRDRVWVALCPPVVTSHVWPLSIWNVTLLNWDTLEV